MPKVYASDLHDFVTALLGAYGAPAKYVSVAADSLVSADLQGVASHGVMLLPMYAERIRAGSVEPSVVPEIVGDHGGLLVMAAGNALGQVSSQVAVELALERAATHGVSIVAVRNGFHFGTASYWTRLIARAGMVGLAFSNTRPLMPPPGGAERVVGNNPMSIAFPSLGGEPLVVDMAMSATAMGKIRLADARGDPIPEGWATDSEGSPTTSAAAAIAGMLLPAAGPKGFGLAVAIDLLCGALSGGAVGSAVTPLYGDADVPYDCSHAFIAIDANKIGGVDTAVAGFADTIRNAAKAPGVDTIYAPGDMENAARLRSSGLCTMTEDLMNTLNALAIEVNIAGRLHSA